VGECIIERGRLAFGSNVQVEVSLVSSPGTGNHIVKWAQLPSTGARVTDEAVVPQVVIVVADENVEHHAGEELLIIAGDVLGRHVTTDGVRQVTIALVRRLKLMAADQSQPTDKRDTPLRTLFARPGIVQQTSRRMEQRGRSR